MDMHQFKNYLISLPRNTKRIIMLVFDSIVISLALWLGLVLRTGNVESYINYLGLILPILVGITLFVFVHFGLYRAVLRFLGIQVVGAVLKGITISTMVLASIVFIGRFEGFPRSVLFIYWLLSFLFIGGSRFLIRNYLVLNTKSCSRKRVAIYGAGVSGHQLSQMLNNNNELRPVCFIDDNEALSGTQVNGLHVYHSTELDDLIESMGIKQILLAIPHVSRARRKEIIDSLERYPVHVFTIPAVEDIVSGRSSVDDIREVDIEDLLGRDPVPANNDLLQACILNKAVMVTGAGGSIGSELCRQIIQLKPTQLILLESSEYALYQIEQDLIHIKDNMLDDKNISITALLGNVQDENRLLKVIRHYKINTIYHAAAYKHVPIVEHNVLEGVQNNVLGTLNAAKAAIAGNVETFVLISTDKAVRPTNVMGATKRFAELILQSISKNKPNTRFCMVRFGNVLGSSGSVVPVFRKQICEGGPITVTHPDIIRYFMTIPEAAQLVIQAGSMAAGGDVFVLDMGEPVKIDDLARKMIHLMGFAVKGQDGDGEIEICYTGLRPGEKLYEELLIGDNVSGTEHKMILRAEESYMNFDELNRYIDLMRIAINQSDFEQINQILHQTVSGYSVENKISDHLYNDKISQVNNLADINLH